MRRFTADDLDFMAGLLGDPAVARFLGGVKDRGGAADTLRTRGLDYYEQHPGLGMWATVERATGRTVGFHVLNHIHGESDIQVGYALSPDVWGLGYASEMALRLVHYGFEDVGLPEICAITDLEHHASQRVLTKIGLERRGERTFAHPILASQGSMAWFVADRDVWVNAHGALPSPSR